MSIYQVTALEFGALLIYAFYKSVFKDDYESLVSWAILQLAVAFFIIFNYIYFLGA